MTIPFAPYKPADPTKHKSLVSPEYAFAYQLECLLTTLETMREGRMASLDVVRMTSICDIAVAAADKFGYLDTARKHKLTKAAEAIVKHQASAHKRKGVKS